MLRNPDSEVCWHFNILILVTFDNLQLSCIPSILVSVHSFCSSKPEVILKRRKRTQIIYAVFLANWFLLQTWQFVCLRLKPIMIIAVLQVSSGGLTVLYHLEIDFKWFMMQEFYCKLDHSLLLPIDFFLSKPQVWIVNINLLFIILSIDLKQIRWIFH